MKQVGFVFPLLLVVCVAVPTPVSEYDAESYKMAVLNTHPSDYHEVAPDLLVNGAYAQDDTQSSLVKGPKVNGGFAINVLPKIYHPRVANGDCAGGYFVDGRCVRSFPKVARVATIEDNMASPEQGDASYETDIHNFVKKHFHESVMKNADEESYHAGLPGYEVVENTMNDNGNEDPDKATQYLFPVGTEIMQDGDQEYDVKFHVPDMNRNHNDYQHPPAEEEVNYDPTDSKYTATKHTDEQPHAIYDNYSPIVLPPSHPTTTDAYQPTGNDANNGAYQPTPNGNSYDGTEHVPTVDVAQEVGDLEYTIPQTPVEEEQGLPPTPTPTPTPDLEELAKQHEAEKEKLDHINSCLAFLEAQDITCTGTEAERTAMSAEHTAPHNDEPYAALLELTAARDNYANFADLRGTYQSLISFCTKKALSEFEDVGREAGKAAEMAQTMLKYADAMSCAAGQTFPQCVPVEAGQILLGGLSHDGAWRCF